MLIKGMLLPNGGEHITTPGATSATWAVPAVTTQLGTVTSAPSSVSAAWSAPTVMFTGTGTFPVNPVVATWSVPAVTTSLGELLSEPDPVIATWSAPAITTSVGEVVAQPNFVQSVWAIPAVTASGTGTVVSTIVTPNLATFSLPAVTASGEGEVISEPAVVSATWAVPVVAASGAGTIVSGPAAVLATWSVPAITTAVSGEATTDPLPVSAAWTVPAVTVVLGELTTTPASVMGVWDANNVTVSLGTATAAPPPVSATWLAPAITINQGVSLTEPDPVSAAWTAPAIVIALGGLTREPDPVSAAWSIEPVMVFGAGTFGVDPAVLNLGLPVVTAGGTGSVSVAPDAVTATWTAPAVTAIAGGTVTSNPAVVVVTWSVPVIAASGSGTVTRNPDPIQATWTAPVITISLGGIVSNTFPAQAIFSVPVAAASGTGTATTAPEAVAATWAAPEVMVFGAGTFGVDPVTATFSVPAITTSLGAVTATPAPISATWAVPAVTIVLGNAQVVPEPAQAGFTAPAITTAAGTVISAVDPVVAGWSVPEAAPEFLYTELGKSSTAIEQSSNLGSHGVQYPFICPSDDLDLLLSDAYLSYKDGECTYALPFSIKWLHGFGTNPTALPGFAPTPVNDYEILIVDANDVTVFDSTQATIYEVEDWASTRDIIEWVTDDAVARVVFMKAWGLNDDPITYDTNIVPTISVLDERVSSRRSPNVNSLRVGLTTLGPDEVVVFAEGYNMDIEVGDTGGDEGGRLVTQLFFDSEIGGGIGKFPGCQDPDIVLRRINGMEPQENGNFFIDATDCYRVQQPGTRFTAPSTDLGFGNVLTPATVQIFNDCEPCCDCEDYLNVYAGLTRVWEDYRDLGDRAEATRDQHAENRDRWNAERECRQSNPCKLLAVPFDCCNVGIGGSHCNLGAPSQTVCNDFVCETDIELRWTFSVAGAAGAAELVCGTTIITDDDGPTQGVVSIEDNVAKAFVDQISTGSAAKAQFVVKFPGCSTGDSVEVLFETFVSGEKRCEKIQLVALCPDPACGGVCEGDSAVSS